jgi:transcriptional regulator with XRE-family HTH domain
MSKKRVASTKEGAQAIGQQLIAIRKARGLTQIDVAKHLNITQTLISKYERGDFLLHGELIAALAQLFQVSTDELLGVESKANPKLKAVAATPAVDRALARRFTLLQSLPRRDREAVTRTIDALISARGGSGKAA